jgi:hypothetical protein
VNSIIIHYILFYGNFVDEGNNLVDNPNIYNVQGDNRLSSRSTTSYHPVNNIWQPSYIKKNTEVAWFLLLFYIWLHLLIYVKRKYYLSTKNSVYWRITLAEDVWNLDIQYIIIPFIWGEHRMLSRSTSNISSLHKLTNATIYKKAIKIKQPQYFSLYN